MNPDEPTHFNAIICGTGITESIVAAALSKAGYSVLHLDQSPTYGDTYASLFLSELAAFASSSPHATASPATPPPELTQKSGKFALSLQPLLLRATGGGIDLLVRSKVASYLQFGLLGGVGLVKPDGGGVERVPASKADVFNDDKLSLVEKRRLTKLLLFAAGNEPLEESKVLAENLEATFINVLQKSFSISPSVAGSIAYALALCSSPDDLALPALKRLRALIHSTGRYGPSPFLVGHYGGAGDLVGGFSRICAVWGGGQILGRPLHPLVLDPPIGPAVSAKPLLSSLSTPAPPPPPSTATLPATEGESGKKGSTEATSRPLGVPVTLDPKDGPVTFTGDWIVTSPSHLPVLFPSTTTSAPPSPPPPTSVYSITILSSPIPFPPPREAPDPEADLAIPDSHMFVFPPGVGEEENMGRLGTVTALQVGSGTFSCPEGYFVLYLAAPILQQPPEGTSAATLLQPYLDTLLALPTPPSSSPLSSADSTISSDAAPPPLPTSPAALYTVSYYPSSSSPAPALTLPANLLITPQPSSLSTGATSSIVNVLDEVAVQAEEMFWSVVGEEGRKEGVEFFTQGVVGGEAEEDD